MTKKVANPFARECLYKVYEGKQNCKLEDLGKDIVNEEYVCCCTVAWCRDCEDTMVIEMPAGGYEYMKSTNMIQVSFVIVQNLADRLTKEHYTGKYKLYLALHHFSNIAVQLLQDATRVRLLAAADPSLGKKSEHFNDSKLYEIYFYLSQSSNEKQTSMAMNIE